MNIQSTQAAPVARHRPLTEIAVMLDRSGSMESIASDAIGGFNAFLASQRDFVPPAATPAATAPPCPTPSAAPSKK